MWGGARCSTPPQTQNPPRDEVGFVCGAKGTRTPDPHTASVVRYQLRHSPSNLVEEFVEDNLKDNVERDLNYSTALRIYKSAGYFTTSGTQEAIPPVSGLDFSSISLPSTNTRGVDTWPSSLDSLSLLAW